MRIALLALTIAAATVSVPMVATAQTEAPSTRTVESDVERLMGTDVETVKDRALEAIDRRLATIDRLHARVTDHPQVTGPHEGELLAELARAEAGLRSLAEEIRQATTIEELRVLVPKIATDFRIYLVVVPKVHLVLGSDSVVAGGMRLEEVAERLEVWIERARANGVDVSDALRYFTDMTESIREAVAVGEPVAGSVLPLTPADWPSPAADVLAHGRTDLVDARQLLRQARDSAQDVVQALREAVGS